MPSLEIIRDRCIGTVLASAAGDALGAPHEFGPPLDESVHLTMTGGGPFGWAPAEWTDDTQQALAIVDALAASPSPAELVGEVERRLVAWHESGPSDVGNQTASVMASARVTGIDLTSAAADWQRRNPDRAGNGSLMRTGPVALAAPRNRPTITQLARAISALTHAHDDALDACALWSLAIDQAIHAQPSAEIDWIELVRDGLEFLAPERRRLWAERIEQCATTPPEHFGQNGYVVTAFQAALASIVQTPVPDDGPDCLHLQRAIERAVRVGDDTDTVAAIAGSLLGARWGASAVPYRWRRTLHGRLTYSRPPLHLAELYQLAHRAANRAVADRREAAGALSCDQPREQEQPTTPKAALLTDAIIICNTVALGDELRAVDAVVSLCPNSRTDIPKDIKHHVIGVLDAASEHPNLGFVLADTADLIHELVRERARVFVHDVEPMHAAAAVAAAYLVRHGGLTADEALTEIGTLLDATAASAVVALLPDLAR